MSAEEEYDETGKEGKNNGNAKKSTCKAPTYKVVGTKLDRMLNKFVGYPICKSKREGYPAPCEVRIYNKKTLSGRAIVRKQKEFNRFVHSHRVRQIIRVLRQSQKLKTKKTFTVADKTSFNIHQQLLEWYDGNEVLPLEINRREFKHNQYDALMPLTQPEDYAEYLAVETESEPDLEIEKTRKRGNARAKKSAKLSTVAPTRTCHCCTKTRELQDFIAPKTDKHDKKKSLLHPRHIKTYMSMKQYRERNPVRGFDEVQYDVSPEREKYEGAIDHVNFLLLLEYDYFPEIGFAGW